MPEIEVPTEHLHEALHEHAHAHGRGHSGHGNGDGRWKGGVALLWYVSMTFGAGGSVFLVQGFLV